jgi:hypothetical protein
MATHSFFCDEGPRSRCYGRTAALRLIVQPCDEDEEKDDQFFSFFRVMEHQWKELTWENRSTMPLCPPQIPHGLTRDRTRASKVRGRRLTAWAMARTPSVWKVCRSSVYLESGHYICHLHGLRHPKCEGGTHIVFSSFCQYNRFPMSHHEYKYRGLKSGDLDGQCWRLTTTCTYQESRTC